MSEECAATLPSHPSRRPYSKSISWRLQFWHAAILVIVVAGLSTAWYLQARRATLHKVDAELLSAARVLDGSLRGISIEELVQKENPSRWLSAEEDLRLTLPRAEVTERGGEQEPYFAIWLRDGRLLKSQRLPSTVATEFDTSLRGAGYRVHRRADSREIRIVGPSESQVLVGRSLSKEYDSLSKLALQILAVAVGILAVGLFGGWRLSLAVLRPISDISDAASRFSATDMSTRIDLKETESELGELGTILNVAFDRVERSFERQRQFAADASHELRTPLAVIQAQIELSLRKERSPEDYVKTLKTCTAASERLSHLVDSLLTLARLDSGESRSEQAPLRLDFLAAKCIDLMRPVAEQAEVNLEFSGTPEWILGTQEQLELALLNLLKNGISYNHQGGHVEVVVGSAGPMAELVVRDSGIGISADDLVHISERFYRADKARSRQQGGSGLGLSIAAQIIEGHGTIMHISSELGQGTTVSIRFHRHEKGLTPQEKTA